MPLKFILKGKSYGIANSILEKNKGSEYYYQFQDCINYLSHCYDKIPDEQLKEEFISYYNSRGYYPAWQEGTMATVGNSCSNCIHSRKKTQ